MHLKSLLVLFIVLLLPNMALAEMMTVGFSGTEMRSAPSAMASRVVAQIAPYSPLSVIEKGAEYYQVKDYRGRSGWVHRSLLSNAPGVVITGDRANVRQGPGPAHPVVFQLSKGMSAKSLESKDKWIHVQTADGKEGWIADFLVWGD